MGWAERANPRSYRNVDFVTRTFYLMMNWTRARARELAKGRYVKP